MKKKLYKVVFTMIEDNTELSNFDSINVVAENAEKAIQKAGKRKNQFIESVTLISIIDRI